MNDLTAPRETALAEYIEVTLVLNPFAQGERLVVRVAVPASLEELVHTLVPDEADRDHLSLFLGGDYVDRAIWARVRPKSGASVVLRIVPQDMVTLVSLLATAGAPAIATSLGLTAATIGTFGAAVAGAAIAMAITYAASALFGPRQSQNRAESSSYAISSARNSLTPYQPVPVVLGTHRMVPPYGAAPYTEIVGNDQYLRFVLIWGYGPVTVSDIKIGNTPIEDYTDVEVEHDFNGSASTLGLYPGDVSQEDLAIRLTMTYVSRTTAANTTEIGVTVTFPLGLFAVDGRGSRVSTPVRIIGNYRLVGDVAWSTWFDQTYVDDTAQVKRVSQRKTGLASGQYEVRLRRVAEENGLTQDNVKDRADWSDLRSFNTDTQPVLLPGIAKSAFRIKATDQLNGVVDQLNAIVSTKIPIWNGSIWTTGGARAATSNPAAIYRYVLRGDPNKKPVAAGNVNDAELAAWYTFCETEGLAFDQVIDFQLSVRDLLQDVANAGKASPAYVDDKWTVVIERPRSTVVQHFTPRNTRNFVGRILYNEIPDALRIRFFNRDADYREDERVIYDDGFNEANATTFQLIDLPGQTVADNVYKLGRHYIASARLRPEVFNFEVDIEHLVALRGDLCRLTHDVPGIGQMSGRIAELTVGRNRFIQTEDLGNAAWTKGALSVSRVSDTTWKLIPNTVSTNHYALQFVVFSGVSTLAVDLKADGYTSALIQTKDQSGALFNFYVNLTTGAVSSTAGSTPAAVNIGGGWFRCSLSWDALSGATTLYVAIFPTASYGPGGVTFVGNGVSAIQARFPQLEAGSVATEYQANTTSVSIIGETVGFVLDEPVTREAGKAYTLRTRITSTGATRVLSVAAASATVTSPTVRVVSGGTGVSVGDLYQFGEENIESLEVLIAGIEYLDDLAASVTCVPYSPAIYDSATTIPPYTTALSAPVSASFIGPPRPTISQVVSDESALQVTSSGAIVPSIFLYVQPGKTAKSNNGTVTRTAFFQARFRRSGSSDPFSYMPYSAVDSPYVQVYPVESGISYDLAVRAIGPDEATTSAFVEIANHTVIGATAKPPEVATFSLNTIGDHTYAEWTYPAIAVDVIGYEIRYSADQNNVAWSTMTVLSDEVPREARSFTVPSRSGSYAIKPIDVLGNRSVLAVYVNASLEDPAAQNVIVTLPQEPLWTGAMTDVDRNGSIIQLRSQNFMSSWTTLASVPVIGFSASTGYASEGYYEFGETDLSEVYTSRITVDAVVSTSGGLSTMAAWVALSGVATMAGDDTGDEGAIELQVNYSLADSPTPVYEGWRRFVVGDYTARHLKFRAVLTSRFSTITPTISALSVSIDMPDRIDYGNDLVSGAGAYPVAFSPWFKEIRAVNIAAQDMQTGDYYTISGKTRSGFSVTFRNSAGTAVSRIFDYQATGYGRERGT